MPRARNILSKRWFNLSDINAQQFVFTFACGVRMTFLGVAAAGLISCASVEGYPKDPESDATLTALQAKYFSPNTDSAYDALDPKDPNYTILRRAARDDIVYGKMRTYDIEFSQFQRALNGSGNEITVGADLTALILNGLGATTGSSTTKSALAAASAGVIGAQGVINKDLYYQKTVAALIAQMESNRTKVKLAIFTGLKQSDSDYPLKRAESDLSDLNDAGSLPNAINNITQQSTDQKNANQTAIKNLQSLSFIKTPSTTAINAWLSPNGKVNQANSDALQAWLNKQPEPFLNGQGYPPAEFANADSANGRDLEPIRQRALKDSTLNIPK